GAGVGASRRFALDAPLGAVGSDGAAPAAAGFFPAQGLGADSLVPYPSTADGMHGSFGLLETGHIDEMTRPLLPDRAADGLFDVRIAAAAPQQLAQVVFLEGKEAIADFAVGRKADSIALGTERPGYGSDDPEG